MSRSSSWLEPSLRGWPRAWEAIKAKHGDYACRCECCGEVWQYMGTDAAGHNFRHRDLNGNGRGGECVPEESGDFELRGLEVVG